MGSVFLSPPHNTLLQVVIEPFNFMQNLFLLYFSCISILAIESGCHLLLLRSCYPSIASAFDVSMDFNFKAQSSLWNHEHTRKSATHHHWNQHQSYYMNCSAPIIFSPTKIYTYSKPFLKTTTTTLMVEINIWFLFLLIPKFIY